MIKRNKTIFIIFLFVFIMLISGCEENVEPDTYFDSLTTVLPNGQYTEELLEICDSLDGEDITIPIAKALAAEHLKNESTKIVYNEGIHSSLYLFSLTRQITDDYDFTKRMFTLTDIPRGRRYAVIQRAFLCEQTIRNIVVVIEVDDSDAIIEPYHLYVFDTSVELIYRGEGAIKTLKEEFKAFEYGRQPDIDEED